MLLVITHLLTLSPNAIIEIISHSRNLVCGQRMITCDTYNGFFPSILTRQALTAVTAICCILTEWTVIIETIHHSTRSLTV